MADLLWAPDVLRAAGLDVIELPGWRERGHGAMGQILGVLCHHTAGPPSGDGRALGVVVPGYPSLNVVVNGRPALAGPLANCGITRTGAWVMVSNGQGWHAGAGAAPWVPDGLGNAHLIGIEAESTGLVDDWGPVMRESYAAGVAALLGHLELPAARALAHKEWAPGRKFDPAFFDMAAFRLDVARRLDSSGGSMTPAELAAVKDAVWQAPVADLFTDAPTDTLPAFGALAWAAANSAFARKAAEDALARVTQVQASLSRIEQKLDALAARPAVVVDTAAIRSAVLTAVTSALGTGLVISGTAVPAKATTS